MVDCWTTKRMGTYEKSNIKCSSHAEDIEYQSIPTTHHTKHCFIWKFSLDMPLDFPRMPEPDMSETNRSPDEEERQSG